MNGYLDHRIQSRMWVNPDMDQVPDVKRDPANWPTLYDLLTVLRPLLKG